MIKNPFVQLVLSHMRGYLREPEAIFWTYGFPLIMVVGLGLAFNSDAEPVITFTVAEDALARVDSLADDPGFEFEARALEDALALLGRNRTPLVVSVAGDGAIEYYFDPTNPEGVGAREKVDDALQRRAGRTDALRWTDRRTDAPDSSASSATMAGENAPTVSMRSKPTMLCSAPRSLGPTNCGAIW
jgi:hypothetical protein